MSRAVARSTSTGASARKRQDTNFKFEVTFHDDAPVSAETFAKKPRTDTSFKFERRSTAPDPGSESDTGSVITTSDTQENAGDSLLPDEASAVAGKKRQDTSFSFEFTTRDDSTDDGTDSAEALGGRRRKDIGLLGGVPAENGSARRAEAAGRPAREDARSWGPMRETLRTQVNALWRAKSVILPFMGS